MVQKVEESFNYVWYVARRRNFARRLFEYMAVLLIGPVAIVVALGMIATLRIDALVEYLRTVAWLGPIVELTSKLTPYLIVTAVFTFLYKTMPNTRVDLKSAFIGGLAGGSMWATISVIFASFVVYSTTKMAIYSGFAVAITTLFWLYLNWLILLIGAQLAFYHQNPAFLRLGRREPRLSNSMRERLALNVMLLVGRAFREGKVKNETVNTVATRLRIPSIALMPIVTALEAQGLLSCTEEEELLPGREMSRIRLDAIVGAVREQGDTGSYRPPKWDVAIRDMGDRIDTAVAGTVGEMSLVQLLDATESAG
jgi:membrane protein